MKGAGIGLFLLMAVFLTGCTTVPTTESRIAHRPDLFQALPKSHQALVHRGEVKEGMSTDAVYLAWGRADEISKSSRRGKVRETWIYLGTGAVRRTGVGFGVGYGYGFGRYNDCYGYDPFFSTGYDYEYQEYVAAKVEFEGGKVVFWERNLRGR